MCSRRKMLSKVLRTAVVPAPEEPVTAMIGYLRDMVCRVGGANLRKSSAARRWYNENRLRRQSAEGGERRPIAATRSARAWDCFPSGERPMRWLPARWKSRRGARDRSVRLRLAAAGFVPDSPRDAGRHTGITPRAAADSCRDKASSVLPCARRPCHSAISVSAAQAFSWSMGTASTVAGPAFGACR